MYEDLRIDPQAPLQTREFFGSTTTLQLDGLRTETLQRVLDGLQLAPPADLKGARLTILRHTVMNPFLLDAENGRNYIDRYFEFLARRIRALG